jgi:hypothetical protein
LVRKSKGKIALGKPRLIWDDNIKMVWNGFIWLRIGTSGRLL